MDVTQVTTLLALVSSFDHRKPDKATAQAWHLALRGVRFDDAQAAVVAHYEQDHRWIMPSDVRKGAARIAQDRRKVQEQMDLPAELEGMEDGPAFTAAYLEWQRTGRVPQGQLTA